MIEILKEHSENEARTRMYRNSMSKTHPITVQLLDDNHGTLIVSTRCRTMETAEKYFNEYKN